MYMYVGVKSSDSASVLYVVDNNNGLFVLAAKSIVQMLS